MPPVPIATEDFVQRFTHPRQPTQAGDGGLTMLRTDMARCPRREVRVLAPKDEHRSRWLLLHLVQTLLVSTGRKPVTPRIVGLFSLVGTNNLLVVQEVVEPMEPPVISEGGTKVFWQLAFDLLDAVLACHQVGIPMEAIVAGTDLLVGATPEDPGHPRLYLLNLENRLRLPSPSLGGIRGLRPALGELGRLAGWSGGPGELDQVEGDVTTWGHVHRMWTVARNHVFQSIIQDMS